MGACLTDHANVDLLISLAASNVRDATDEVQDLAKQLDEQGPAVVGLGRKGGKARAAELTAEQRSEIAWNAARERWSRNS